MPYYEAIPTDDPSFWKVVVSDHYTDPVPTVCGATCGPDAEKRARRYAFDQNVVRNQKGDFRGFRHD